MEQGDFEPCPPPPKPFVNIIEDGFGFVTNDDGSREIVRRYTFTNQNNFTVQVITYGAAITSVKYPDKDGIIDDVVLGFDDLDGYLSPANPYFGAIVGRYANRIAAGHFKIGNDDYQLSLNNGKHHLHGGFKGFDKANWKSDIQDKKVVLTYLSKDGEEGYPGEVLASVSYEVTTENDLIIEMKATSSKPTPINLTNHSYFNLAGHNKGSSGLYQHFVSINADKFCHTDEEFIPSGMLKNVVNTLWDLRIPRKLGSTIQFVPYGGYDQNMCIHKTSSECVTFIARVHHPESGRTLEVYSNQPGVQFYTSNYLPVKQYFTDADMDDDGCQVRRCPLCGQLIRDPDFENYLDDHANDMGAMQAMADPVYKLFGKEGAEYYKHAAFCLMTQKFPDSVHRKNFPDCILKPGDSYHHIVTYKFDIYEEVTFQIEDDEVSRSEIGEGGEGEGEGEGG